MRVYASALLISLLFCFGALANNNPLKPNINWHIQLDGKLKVPKNIQLIEIDLFETSDKKITALKSKNIMVICYFSAGTFEDWRSDISQIPKSSLGKPMPDWEGETWWNVNHKSVRDVILSRLNLAKSKGCDGVDPDNVDFYDNDTGLPITQNDTLEFLKWLADQTHKLNLKIALKNAGTLATKLANYFDLNVTEQCFEYNSCEEHLAFTKVGKPVLNIEYKKKYINNPTSICFTSNKLKISTLILPLNLDSSFRISCNKP